MAQVTLKNVSKIADSGAVQDFTLEVRDREFAVLAGPSGCGHSTLLRLIAGLDPLSSGEILIGSRPVQTLPPAERDVAMVFRQAALFPHWTAQQNIAFGLKGRHFLKTEIEKKVKEAANVVGVTELLDRKPASLTAVEQLRVALARAIVRQPKVILLDDPLSILDPESRPAMRAELVKLQERLQTTLLYATQDPLEAMILGHRVAVMNCGALQQFDTPLRIYNHPTNRFAAQFLGRPPMNLLSGRLRTAQTGLLFKETGGTVEIPFTDSPELKALAGKDVVLGIRPEDIRVVAPDAVTKARGARCQGIVDHVEMTGAEIFYTVQTGGHTLVIQGTPDAEPAGAGRRMAFDIDAEKSHLFDAETTTRLL